MTKPIDKRGEGQRNLRELFQDYTGEFASEEWDTGAPVGKEIFDQFYGETNQRRLQDSLAQFKMDGVVIVKTIAELEAMEKED